MSWSVLKDGNEISRGTGLVATYTDELATVSDRGAYTIVFTNTLSTASSDVANVFVNDALVASLEIVNESGVTELYPDTHIQLSANLTDEKQNVYSTNDFPNIVTWSSSNDSIATVDSQGLVIPMGKGAATITATTTHLDSNGETLSSDLAVTMVFVGGQFYNITVGWSGSTNDIYGYSSTAGYGSVNESFDHPVYGMSHHWFRGGANTFYGGIYSDVTNEPFFGLSTLYFRWVFPDGTVFESKAASYSSNKYDDEVRYRDYPDVWAALSSHQGEACDVYLYEFTGYATALNDADPLYDHTFLYDG